MRKFADIIPPQITEQRGGGDDYGNLVKQTNQALQELTDKVNRTLQNATGNMGDFGLWGRGEVVEVYCNDRQPSRGGRWMVAVKHGLGKKPRYGLVISKHDLHDQGPTEWKIAEMVEDPWTDTHVYFQVPPAGTGDEDYYKVLLLP